ncbi:unnamed protein product [Didymodactylos carnosus]|uniref:DYW domain-containing protein n=1 Tax=Didymodactylos carnosus TaxID=1234261 RepID=A0A814A8Y7_9BILA|nr:unnamed protein product [Didymodactylos carnosus]CAF3691978.1 unnamed protein product [Didymodactylos carnosus]
MPMRTLHLGDKMKQENIEFDTVSYVLVISACAQIGGHKGLEMGKYYHEQMKKYGTKWNDDIILQNTLIDLYGRSGDTDTAEKIFHEMNKRNTSTYNVLMKCYNVNKMPMQTLHLANKMEQENIRFDIVSYVLIISACAQTGGHKGLETGKYYHEQMKKDDTKWNDDIILQNTLIDLYGRSGDTDTAEKIFHEMNKRNTSTYNVLMKCYNVNKMPIQTLHLANKMEQENIRFDIVSYVLVISACAQTGGHKGLETGKYYHEQMQKYGGKWNDDIVVKGALIDLYGRSGDIKMAEKIFHEMNKRGTTICNVLMKCYNVNKMPMQTLHLANKMEQENIRFDVVSYVLIISACTQIGSHKGLEMGKYYHEQMKKDGAKWNDDIILQNTLIDLYGRSGDTDTAEKIFHEMNKRNTSTYNVLMKCYNVNEMPMETLHLADKMKQQKLELSAVSYTLAVNACAQLGLTKLVKDLYEETRAKYKNYLMVESAFVDAFSKCGDIGMAKTIFRNMKEYDVVAVTAMINGFGLNGHGLEAIDLFHKMTHELGLVPDEQTYVCAINSCSHSGLISEAKTIFRSIDHKNEQIYTAMVDTLARMFLFDEAQYLIEQYEEKNKPYLPMYMALLSGARKDRNSSRAQDIYDRMRSLDVTDKNSLAAAAVLLANTYAGQGYYNESIQIKDEMIRDGLKKVMGLSWTTVNGLVHYFKAHDRRHPRSDEIYKKVDELAEEAKKDGYEYDRRWVMRGSDSRESDELLLCGHSEKLAIAFNFVASLSRPVERIQVVKNLRVCGDCHEFTKRISKLRKCEIIVRDRHRIHHFRGGNCSCSDYF